LFFPDIYKNDENAMNLNIAFFRSAYGNTMPVQAKEQKRTKSRGGEQRCFVEESRQAITNRFVRKQNKPE